MTPALAFALGATTTAAAYLLAHAAVAVWGYRLTRETADA